MANALRPRRVNSSTWSFIIETKGVTTKTQALCSFHKSFSRHGSNWKIRLFPKPVGRIPKTSRFCATVSRHSFCSCFKPEMWWKCCKELLKAASNSTSVNCKLHAEAIFVGRGRNYVNLHAVVKICQIFISKLLKAVNSHRFNQSDLDTRSWYHGTAPSMECLQAPPCTPSSPDSSRLVPLALFYTRLARSETNREPVCRLQVRKGRGRCFLYLDPMG